MAERDVIINLVVKGGDTSSQQLEKVAQSEQDVAVSARQATDALDNQTKELQQNSVAAANLSKQNQSLRGQLRAIQQELAKLALAGKANTEEYKRLRDEAGNLQDAIADAAAEIRQAGSDTRGLDQVIRVATTATAAFGLVQGAAALFGDENEELQKSLLKVNAALTVLTSLQQIQEELSRKDSVFTAAAAKAKLLYAAAVGTSSGALRIFRLALVATGIGAAVVAIGLLVANWDKLSRAITKSFPRLADFGEQVQKIIQVVTDFLGLTSKEQRAQEATLKTLEAKNKQLEREADLLSAQGNNVAAAEKRLEISKNQLAILKAQNAAEEDVKDAINDVKIAEQEVTNAKNDAAEAALKKTKATKDETKEIQAQTGSLAFLNAQLQKLTELQSKSADVTQIAKYQQQIDDLQTRIAILNREIASFISFQNRVSENAETNFKPIITEVERVKTDAELAADAYEKLPQAIKDANAELAKNPPQSTFAGAPTPEQIRAEEQRVRDQRIAAAQQTGTALFGIFRQAQEAQQQVLENRLKQGLISEQEYQQEIAKIRRKEAIASKAQALFDIALNTATAIIAALKIQPGGAILAGIAAAIGALQAATVAATPIPKFRKGGDVDILKGGREKLGQLFGNSHEQGGILIEAEGGEHITRKSMAKKYRPLLHAINSDTVDSFLKPNALALPMPKRLSNSEIKSSRQAEKRMAELIEEVRFLSQYVRQGNKYAKVTADTNTQMVNKKTAKVYV